MQRFKTANIITMSLVSIIPLLVTNNKINTPNLYISPVAGQKSFQRAVVLSSPNFGLRFHFTYR